jgi:hypothetical protein
VSNYYYYYYYYYFVAVVDIIYSVTYTVLLSNTGSTRKKSEKKYWADFIMTITKKCVPYYHRSSRYNNIIYTMWIIACLLKTKPPKCQNIVANNLEKSLCFKMRFIININDCYLFFFSFLFFFLLLICFTFAHLKTISIIHNIYARIQ